MADDVVLEIAHERGELLKQGMALMNEYAARNARLLAALTALVTVTESIVRDADTSQCDVEWNDVLQFAHAAIAEAERG